MRFLELSVVMIFKKKKCLIKMSKVILMSSDVAASLLSKLYGTDNTNLYNTGSGYPISLNQLNAYSVDKNFPNQNQANSYSSVIANQINNVQDNGKLSNVCSLAQMLPLPTPSINDKRRRFETYPLSQLDPSLSQNTITIVGAPNVQLPDSFDARIKWPGLITGPLDQQDCSSCWAFSTATSFSDRLRISGRAGPDLFETFTYQVSPTQSYRMLNNINPYNLLGNNLANAFQYLITNGANTFSAIQPTSYDLQFTTQKPVYKGSNKIMICQPNDSDDVREQKMKHEIYANGPISVAFSIYDSFYTFFEQNPTGIYSSEVQSVGDTLLGTHAVVVLGWGQEKNTKYWIVRNSWGFEWGDNGYFKMEINWRPPNNVAGVLMSQEAWSLI
jgi:C1A family cysteine protease